MKHQQENIFPIMDSIHQREGLHCTALYSRRWIRRQIRKRFCSPFCRFHLPCTYYKGQRTCIPVVLRSVATEARCTSWVQASWHWLLSTPCSPHCWQRIEHKHVLRLRSSVCSRLAPRRSSAWMRTAVRSRETTTIGRSIIMVGVIRRVFQVVCADEFGIFLWDEVHLLFSTSRIKSQLYVSMSDGFASHLFHTIPLTNEGQRILYWIFATELSLHLLYVRRRNRECRRKTVSLNEESEAFISQNEATVCMTAKNWARQ